MKKAIIVALFLVPVCSHANDDIRKRFDFLFGEHEIYEKFFYELKSTILNGDSKKLAAMNSYPLNVIAEKEKIQIHNESDFIEKYALIINTNIVDEVRKQTFEELFSNYQGVMIGRGQVWFAGLCIGDVPGKECDEVVVKVVTYNNQAPKTE